MPGPISQSYEGPSDDKPVVPEWAIQTPATAAVDSPGPLSYEEAKHFHDGFLAGATAYAAAVGHSTLFWRPREQGLANGETSGP